MGQVSSLIERGDAIIDIEAGTKGCKPAHDSTRFRGKFGFRSSEVECGAQWRRHEKATEFNDLVLAQHDFPERVARRGEGADVPLTSDAQLQSLRLLLEDAEHPRRRQRLGNGPVRNFGSDGCRPLFNPDDSVDGAKCAADARELAVEHSSLQFRGRQVMQGKDSGDAHSSIVGVHAAKRRAPSASVETMRRHLGGWD